MLDAAFYGVVAASSIVALVQRWKMIKVAKLRSGETVLTTKSHEPVRH
jgi:hypothetical protein